MIKDKISIITVNYNGLNYLGPLFDSLEKQTYKNYEIVFVDNNSSDDSIDFVKKNYPNVKIVKNDRNLGFAGGNNSALPYCDGEYVALINNDMVADANWLQGMYRSILRENADIIGSKILFYKPFVTLKFKTNTFNHAGNNLGEDRRDLGCKIESNISFKNVSYRKTIFLNNTFGEEVGSGKNYHWIGSDAIIKLPVDLNLDKFILEFEASKSNFQKREKLSILVGGEKIFEDYVSGEFIKFSINVDRNLIVDSAKCVINNAGSEIDPITGSGRDIGMNEDDCGQYDTPKELFSLCGGSMLIKKELVNRYGLFDDYFFAYYEDADFCWRMKNKKKKIFFEPRSFVYHVHTGTSREWSPFFRYHVERNRLAMMLKNGKVGDIFREWASFYFKTAEGLPFLAKSYILIKNRKNEINAIRIINIKVSFDLFIHLIPLILRRVLNNLKK